MGNSEVGHLNLGAGAIVPQDLARIDEAVEDGSLAENEVLRAALARRRARAPDRAGVRRRRALRPTPPEGADRAGAPSAASRTSSSTRSPTGATRRRRGGAGYLATVEGWCAEAGDGRVGSVIGRYFAMDRDKRWDRIAEGLRPARARQRPSTTPTPAPTAVARRLRARRDRRVHHRRRRSATRRAIRPGDSVIAFNFRPDRMREITLALADPGFAEVDRGGAEPVERYATLTEYEEDWAYPVAFPPERPAITIAAGDRRARAAPAARRRDREVPARDVLLQRRRGGAVRGRGARARAVAARRADLRLQARDERARGAPTRSSSTGREDDVRVRDHQLRQRGHGRPHRRDPGGGRRRSRPSTRASARSSRRSTRPAAPASSPPTTATPTRCSRTTARPNTAHSLNPVPFIVTARARALDGEGILADVAPTVLALLGIEQPAEMTGRSLLE